MIAFQSGMTNNAIVSRIVFHSWLRESTIVTSACYPTRVDLGVGCPSSSWRRAPASSAARPGPSGRGRRGRSRRVVVTTARPRPARRRASIPDRRRRQLRPLEPPQQPRGPGCPGAFRPERGPEGVIVADDEQRRRCRCSGDRARLVHERQQHLVRSAPAGMTHDQSGRDPLPAHARVRCAIEPHQLDADRTRDDRPEPADQGRLRRGARLARQGVEQVRPVDEQPVGAGEGIAGKGGHRPILRGDRATATIGGVSLLLLVDLDGVVYRGVDPVPAWPRSSPTGLRAATTSSTSPTTPCTTGPTT